ncbi:MAG: hypothetical protein V4510_06750 [bacterium]
MNARSILITGAALVALAISSSAADVQSGYGRVDGVTYYMAFGGSGSGVMALGSAPTGHPTAVFAGCALAQLRPEREHGIVRMVGVVDGITPVTIDVSSFHGGGDKQGGIATNITLDGALDDGPDHPAVLASAAAWGTARISVNGANFTDPVGDGEEFTATFFAANDGLRDDATHALAAKPVAGQSEFHLRVRSPTGAAPKPATFHTESPDNLPAGLGSYAPEYKAFRPFANVKYGGKAVAHVTTSADAPPGLNQLTFTVLSPIGAAVANQTVAFDATTNGKVDLPFDLDHLGMYGLQVTGKMATGHYAVDIEMTPPSDFDLNMWWDSVLFGLKGRAQMSPCTENLESTTGVSAAVGRPKPPQYPVQDVILAVAGTAVGLLVAVKLVMHTRSTASFRRSTRR